MGGSQAASQTADLAEIISPSTTKIEQEQHKAGRGDAKLRPGRAGSPLCASWRTAVLPETWLFYPGSAYRPVREKPRRPILWLRHSDRPVLYGNQAPNEDLDQHRTMRGDPILPGTQSASPRQILEPAVCSDLSRQAHTTRELIEKDQQTRLPDNQPSMLAGVPSQGDFHFPSTLDRHYRNGSLPGMARLHW